MKVRTTLPDGYPGELRPYRRAVAGRLELLQVYGDGEPFWMVRLRGVSEKRDRATLNLVSKPWGNGHFRFVDEKEARAKFEALAAFPQYAAEAEHAARIKHAQKERLAAAITQRGKDALLKWRALQADTAQSHGAAAPTA